MPEVLCFVSAKGGAGKTVASASLATFLSEIGMKVLLIDTDAATNGLTLLFLEQLLRGTRAASEPGIGLFEAKENEAPTILNLGENLALVPATYELRDTERTQPHQMERALVAALQMASGFDVVLLDAQAGVDRYAQVAAQHATTHIIVSEYDPISVQGVDRLKIIFSEQLTSRSTYTLFNKILPEFADVIGEGLSVARYLPPIPWDIEVIRAFTRRDLAIDISAPNAFTLAIAQLAMGSLGDFVAGPIEEWRGRQFASTLEPTKDQLQQLRLAQYKLKSSGSIWRFPFDFSVILTPVIVGIFGTTLGLASFFLEDKTSLDLLRLTKLNIIAVVIITVGFVTTALTAFLVSVAKRRQEKNAWAAMELESEISALETTLKSAEAALRATEGGVFASRRRAEFSKDRRPNRATL